MYECNKSKPIRQAVKIEKENENINLRKKTKSLNAGKHLTNKRETVWDRLSKVKGVATSRNERPPQGFYPLRQPYKHTAETQLITTASSIKRRPDLLPKICTKEENAVPKVDEIFHVNSSCQMSKSSSSSACTIVGRNIANAPIESYPQNYNRNSENHMRPSKWSLRNDVENVRRNDQTVEYKGIEIVKYSIESGGRCGHLKEIPKFAKDVLKAQMQNIYTQEITVNIESLKNLDSSLSLRQHFEIESRASTSKSKINTSHRKETQELEVDVVFRNIPSLDKEIQILKALGDKLEATLKSTATHVSKRDPTSHKSIVSLKKPLFSCKDENQSRLILKVKCVVCDLAVEHNVQFSVHLIGIRHCLGVIKEFQITEKSILELKRDASRLFYIPTNSERVQLVRTSFKKLRETPHELLRHVRPRDSQVPFNLLEQDAVFFHSIFNKITKTPNAMRSSNYRVEESPSPVVHTDGEGEGNIHSRKTTDKESLSKDKSGSYELELVSGIDSQFCNVSPIRGKQRRRIRRCTTPMPIRDNHNPKNSLFKTILVGFVQMSVFILFIMALTYPQARC